LTSAVGAGALALELYVLIMIVLCGSGAAAGLTADRKRFCYRAGSTLLIFSKTASRLIVA
jgi:hypothetical protein